MLAIVEAYQAGLLNAKNWWPNLLAGTIVGIVALPLSMAFAIASGADPEQGLYTAIIAGFVVGFLGGSRLQIAGPTGAFVVILANIVADYGISGLQLATVMAGFMLLLMGFLRLGSLIKFIPDTVISGFTAGIGTIIFVGEWKSFLGLHVDIPIHAKFHEKLITLIYSLPGFNWHTTILALISLSILIVTPKLFKRIPGALIAMVAATIVQVIFQSKEVATLGSAFGGIPQILPKLQIPLFSYTEIKMLLGPAFSIALLGAIESLLSAAVADKMAGTRHHSNQELIGQGLANIIAPLFGGFAATGAIARTATNVRSGGNCALSAAFHSIFLVLVILLLAPLAKQVPICSLAAILFYIAYNMSDLPHCFRIIKHGMPYEIVLLITSFMLTVFVNLIIAIFVGTFLWIGYRFFQPSRAAEETN